jgi:hypothetical protein
VKTLWAVIRPDKALRQRVALDGYAQNGRLSSMNSIALKLLLALTMFSGVALAACGDDKDDDAHGEEDVDGDCGPIVEACHDVDEGEGKAYECHVLAHDNDVEMCTSEKEACLEACAEHAH